MLIVSILTLASDWWMPKLQRRLRPDIPLSISQLLPTLQSLIELETDWMDGKPRIAQATLESQMTLQKIHQLRSYAAELGVLITKLDDMGITLPPFETRRIDRWSTLTRVLLPIVRENLEDQFQQVCQAFIHEMEQNQKLLR